MTTTTKDKFLALVSDTPSGWLEKAQWREENEAWLDKSFMIALRVIKTLREKGMSQKDLAAQMGVSPQQVSKILKGTENLTLETISAIENALQITLIEVPSQAIQQDVVFTFEDTV